MSIFSKIISTHNSKFRLLKTFLVIVAAVVFLYACKKTNVIFPVDCTGPAKSFANDVHPVIQASCAINSGCHASSSNNGPGPLLNYAEIFNARSVIRSAVASRHMPLNGTLNDAEINAILCWIDSGGADN